MIEVRERLALNEKAHEEEHSEEIRDRLYGGLK